MGIQERVLTWSCRFGFGVVPMTWIEVVIILILFGNVLAIRQTRKIINLRGGEILFYAQEPKGVGKVYFGRIPGAHSAGSQFCLGLAQMVVPEYMKSRGH